MKQKIVIQVPMTCDKCRSKALKIASGTKGSVDSVALGGNQDRVVVIGEDVDSVCLAKDLRKKFRHATIVSVEEVKAKKEEQETVVGLPVCHYPYPPHSNFVCEQYRDETCTIM